MDRAAATLSIEAGVIMRNLFEKLPQSLRDNAYVAGEESAWYRDDALGVVEFCKEQGIAVLGGEVWLPTHPGPTIPTPFIYTWEVDEKISSESWTQFVGRASEMAKKYIEEFSWDPADTLRSQTPMFNLTHADESEYQCLT
jgi:hypothetical protein